MGMISRALGMYCDALGMYSYALGMYSYALGLMLEAFAEGCCNTSRVGFVKICYVVTCLYASTNSVEASD